MGKRRTRLQTPPRPEPDAIIVDNPTKVTTHVVRVLREILGDPSVRFQEVALPKNEVKFELSGSASKGTARDKYSVFPLDQVGSELLWLGGALVFKRELGNFRLKSVSILIFKGDAFDEVKTVLLRAEWDNPDEQTLHAQPHWHIYPRLLGETEVDLSLKESEIIEAFEPIESESLLGDPLSSNSARFHYAMASKWHRHGPNAHQEKLNDLDHLINWLKGCIAYTREQLVWLFT